MSIIMPSLNQGEYIGEAICSVLEQSSSDTELIIIDGGSSDNTLDVIKRYAHHLTYWISEPDNGQSDAINKGLAKATGEVINWLNSDDYYSPNILPEVARAFIDPDIHCVSGVTRVFGLRHDRLKRSYVNKNSLQDTLCNLLIEQPSTFFRAEVFRRLAGLRSDLHYVMDRDLWIRFLGMFGLCSIAQIDTTLINFRHHADSKTVSQQQKFFEEYAALLSQFCQNAELCELLKKVAGNRQAQIEDITTNLEIDNSTIDAMVVFFLVKYARDLSQTGNFELSKQVLDRITLSDYGLGSRQWKWVRQQSQESAGYLLGSVNYLGLRYLS